MHVGGVIQGAGQRGQRRPARFDGGLLGGGVDGVGERDADRVVGLREGGGEVVRAGDGVLGEGPVASHGDGADGQLCKLLAVADPQAQRAGPRLGGVDRDDYGALILANTIDGMSRNDKDLLDYYDDG